MTPPASPSFRALLAGSVDYAGLFPPAGVALEPALGNYAEYVRSGDAWMLARFVLPVEKLREAGPLLGGRFDFIHPLRVSVLGSKAIDARGILENLLASLDELVSFRHAHGKESAIDQFEAPLTPADTTGTSGLRSVLGEAAGLIETLLPGPLRVFWEVPISGDLPETLRGFTEHNAAVPRTARCRPFGVKVRTGGTEAVAFPTAGQLADALLSARDAGVALKFTAGLHHPLRHFDEGLGTQMHGFLNVFAAVILAREHRLDAVEVRDILEDEDAAHFRFEEGGFAWRHRRVATDALAEHRKFVTSFGSCSFDEPRDDLRRLGLMD